MCSDVQSYSLQCPALQCNTMLVNGMHGYATRCYALLLCKGCSCWFARLGNATQWCATCLRRYAMVWIHMQRLATPCKSMQRHELLCTVCARLHNAMQWIATMIWKYMQVWYAMICRGMQCCAILWNVMQCYAVLWDAMQRCAAPCNELQWCIYIYILVCSCAYTCTE